MGGLAYIIIKINKQPRIAYVKSNELVYGFLGMKEAHAKQTVFETQVKIRIDSLRMGLQNDIAIFNTTFSSLNKEERVKQKEQLMQRENSFRNFAEATEKQIKESDQKLTSGVLNQINAYVEKYGDENGYDIVLGTTTSGNILFAKNYLDITDEVLENINKNYNPSINVNEIH
jgi:outer membrane protein